MVVAGNATSTTSSALLWQTFNFPPKGSKHRLNIEYWFSWPLCPAAACPPLSAQLSTRNHSMFECAADAPGTASSPSSAFSLRAPLSKPAFSAPPHPFALVFIPPLPPPPWPASPFFPLKLLCKPPSLKVQETGTIYLFFFFFTSLIVFWWFLKQKRKTGHLSVLRMGCRITLISQGWSQWMFSKWL